jgi:hypothetical protein
VDPKATGRPSYHPSALLKLYIYGYLNRFQSSRRLEREAGRNVEVMWLTGRLVPDHKTIADFRKDNGRAIRQVCTRFKFKAINNRDKNFTRASHQGVIKKDPLDSEGISNPIDITALSTCQRPRKTTTAVIAGMIIDGTTSIMNPP